MSGPPDTPAPSHALAGALAGGLPGARVWQRMLSGRRLDLLDPSPLDVEIEDIAHGLARVPRWNGQTRGPHAFSVAQHSLLVLDIVRVIEPATGPAEAQMVLLHDAPEYVIGDMISPFKAVLGDGYRQIEARLLAAIHTRFALPATPAGWVRTIKRADRVAAFHEAVRLAGFGPAEARRVFGQARVAGFDDRLLEPVSPSRAQSAYLAAFRALERARRETGGERA